ncbi:MAG TPA: hypothetical protein VGF58_05420 [Burkholderiales bacterium]|jgi:hypothetical protein
MALDFSIVTDVRQRFGDYARGEKESAPEADTPIGLERSFAFRCPSVDRRQFAILLFQTLGVALRQGLEINGQTIFGGIAPSVDPAARILGPRSPSADDLTTLATWNGNVMLIHPGVLQESNILRIRAADATAANIDDFLVDNVVVVFKTAQQVGGSRGGTAKAGKKRAKKRKK